MASENGDNAIDESIKNHSIVDDELDSLLDDALADFDKLSNHQKEKEKTSKPKDNKPTIDTTEMPLEDQMSEAALNDIFGDVLKMMSGDSKGGPVSGASAMPDMNGSINETIQRAINNLNKDIDNIEAGGGGGGGGRDMNQEMMDLLSKMNLGNSNDDDDDDEDAMAPLLHDMMSSLLAKDVIYSCLKEVADKYPQWLSENEGKLEPKELRRYRKQHIRMERIVREYESESESDDQKTKKERFERILDHMQKLQQFGDPPKEILGDVSLDSAFGEGGFLPKMANMGFDPKQCSMS